MVYLLKIKFISPYLNKDLFQSEINIYLTSKYLKHFFSLNWEKFLVENELEEFWFRFNSQLKL